MTLLGLESTERCNLLYIFNRNLKNNSLYTCAHKQMIAINNIRYMPNNYNKEAIIPFHPLNQTEDSCSYLLIDDSIHLYLRNLTFGLFRKIIPNINNKFDTIQLDNLSNPTKYTIYKFYNLLNIVSATSFSKNLISFKIDFTNSPKEAKVNFKYPLYDMLNRIQNNTLFGIHLEDNEIKLFKQIYENDIITIIDNLFREPIKISEQSDQYPQFYILMTIKLMLEETYWKNYNICFINCKRMLSKYKEMLSDLNRRNQYDKFTRFDNIYTDKDRKLDQEAYKNELQIRQVSEPDWFTLKDTIMKDQNNLISTEEINRRFNKQYWNKYLQKISTLIVNKDIESLVLNNEQIENQTELAEILYMQRLVLNIINEKSGRLWFDIHTGKYFFRSTHNEKVDDYDKKTMTKILNAAMQKNLPKYHIYDTDFLNQVIEVVLIETIDDIAKHKLQKEHETSQVVKILLFTKAIPTVNGDVFDLAFTEEIFQSDTDLLFKKNRFVPNKYLEKRYQILQSTLIDLEEQTFTEKFIYQLVKENKELFDYIINWLAYYFQNLQKTKTALVLLGDQEVTQDIFWNAIIKEIFGQQYCTTINDEEYENTTLVSNIAKDRLFFHIGDIDNADTKFDDKTLALIIKDLLIKPSLTTNTNEEIPIHGQILITAKNPAPYLKKVLSKCTVIDTSDMNEILEKLDIEDEGDLEGRIETDLKSFTDMLLHYNVTIDNVTKIIDTEARQILKGKKTSNINKDDIDKNINDFIQAIKDKDIDYFEKVYGTKDKKGGDVYEHLKYAFNKDDGYFIGQDLYLYYNAIYKPPFETNKILMDRLKAKDKMFRQEVKVLKILTKDGKEDVLFSVPSGGKETGNKDLYKITDYKLAEDIKIPDGATVISSQEKLDKFTFTSKSEEEKCIQRTKEYKDKKKKEKEQK